MEEHECLWASGATDILLWLNREDCFHWHKQLVPCSGLICLWARAVYVWVVRKLIRLLFKLGDLVGWDQAWDAEELLDQFGSLL